MPPISRLDDDILSTIFDIITKPIPRPRLRDMLHRPLKHVQAASQVCRYWRRLLLASSRIWGRVIDLDVVDYGPGRKEWMEEILRRTGSAPLWISGNVAKAARSSVFDKEAYFIQLLELWERIERLAVAIQGKGISNDIQRHFLRRAPILKSFDVYLPEVQKTLFMDTLQPSSPKRLFADYAPSLVEMNAEQVAFKLDAPWLSTIRMLSPIPRRMNKSEVFTLLQKTPIIETFLLLTDSGRIVWDPMDRHAPRLHLRNLSAIYMVTSLAISAIMLDYLIPGQLSALRINVIEYAISFPKDVLSHFKNTLPRYITNYFTANTSGSHTITFELTKSMFRFQTVPPPEAMEHSFYVSINILGVQRYNEDLFASLLDTFTLTSDLEPGARPPFETITHLRLRLEDIHPTLFRKLYSMFSTFQHVREIQIDENCIPVLWSLSYLEDPDSGTERNRPFILFPALHTLRLKNIHIANSNMTDLLIKFLEKRRDCGYPVARLNLTDCKQDLSALKSVDRLEIVWKEGNVSGIGDDQ